MAAVSCSDTSCVGRDVRRAALMEVSWVMATSAILSNGIDRLV